MDMDILIHINKKKRGKWVELDRIVAHERHLTLLQNDKHKQMKELLIRDYGKGEYRIDVSYSSVKTFFKGKVK